MAAITIRDAQIEDTERLLEIYAYYVEQTAISFEYDVPSLEEFRARMKRTMARYPYLVAEWNGTAAGYAYAGPFVGRAAYGWCCELTIYLDHTMRHQGMGRALYDALAERLRQMGVLNLYACIGYTDSPDQYLDGNSAAFHAHMGFGQVGVFHKCGYKFDRWYDMIWMEKIIGPHGSHQPAVCAPKSSQ